MPFLPQLLFIISNKTPKGVSLMPFLPQLLFIISNKTPTGVEFDAFSPPTAVHHL